MPKVGRNSQCPCGSGKKYKKCCLQKDIVDKANMFITGHETTSETLNEVKEYISHINDEVNEVIDITNKLSRDTYANFQTKNRETSRVMVAENVMRNNKISFGNSTPFIMVLFKGFYFNFDYANFEEVKPALERMINEDFKDFQCNNCDGHVNSPSIECNSCNKRTCIPCITDIQNKTSMNMSNNKFNLQCPKCEEEGGLEFSAARVSDF